MNARRQTDMHEEEANESGNSVEEVEATLIGFVYIFFQFFLFRSYRPEPVTKHAIFPFFSLLCISCSRNRHGMVKCCTGDITLFCRMKAKHLMSFRCAFRTICNGLLILVRDVRLYVHSYMQTMAQFSLATIIGRILVNKNAHGIGAKE